MAKQEKVPGPRRWSPFGSLPELRRDPLGSLLRAREAYGDVVKFRAGIWYSYLLSHPDDIKHVLQDNHQNYHKGFTYQYLKPILGEGLITNEGESWLRQRRLAQPAFHRQKLAGLTEIITGSVERLRERWRAHPPGAMVDVAAEMTQLTIEIVTRALLGSDLGAAAAEVSDAVRVGQEHVNWRITHLFSLSERWPTPGNLRFNRSLAVLDRVVYSIIEARRARNLNREALPSPERGGLLPLPAGEGWGEGHPQSDLLTLLLEARDEETGEGMTDRQLRDEVMTIFLAGHETTANALAWTWHLLSLHPEVEERLQDEVDSVLAGRLPQLEDLARLQYTRMVLDESLRLYPPGWAVGRFPLSDDEAGGYRIPAHTQVILSSYVTHRHPEFWDDPERFDPERFRPERAAQRPRFAYFPFGGGPRICIGNEFALMEGVLALAAIAQEFRLSAVPGHPVAPEALITLRPRGGLPMFVESRERPRGRRGGLEASHSGLL